MKHREILRCILVVSILVAGIIIFAVLYNVIVIRSRIYYEIDYNINLSNREEIIHKVENLNYPAYLNNYPYPYYYHADINSYFDRDLIDFLKSRIENDSGFKWSLSYQHYLRYFFLGENHSKLYLTYSNNTIFSLKDKNNQSLFLREDNIWLGFYWYLDFTQIPYVYGDNSTLVLSELIFVKINLEYEWNCGYVCLHQYSFEQYLLLSKNLDVILIFIYHKVFID